MKKIISYSLYGDGEKYLIGAIRNAGQIGEFYPGWVARFFVGDSVGDGVAEALKKLGAEVVRMPGEKEDASAMFWRYRPFFDPDVSIVMVRDADSRLSIRELHAVNAWLDSGGGVHIMRDHPAHCCAILGGLWGARTDYMRKFYSVFEQVRPEGVYGEDQQFLRDHIYPVVKRDAVIHDSFFAFEWSAIPFPSIRDGLGFVGEVFDENDQPRISDRETLAYFESSIFRRWRLKGRSLIRGCP